MKRQAAEAAAKAAELHGAAGGGNATSAFNAGAILVNSGKFAEALVQFQRAIRLDPYRILWTSSGHYPRFGLQIITSVAGGSLLFDVACEDATNRSLDFPT